jgi:ferredoxin--NADP+ reductase
MSTVAVIGCGPAGFAVASAILDRADTDTTVTLVERDERPDALLRHGPGAGPDRLRRVAHDVDAVLADDRVDFFGGVDIADGAVPLDDLRAAADAVVLATGSPLDLPLRLAGRDSVGVGTLTHVEAWLTGNADVDLRELDLDVDSAVLVGAAPETFCIAAILAGDKIPDGVPDGVDARLATSRLRHVQVVDSRSVTEFDPFETGDNSVVVRAELTPIGVVGRNRARALRCLRRPDADGRVLVEDLRAQLLLRPRAKAFPWRGLDQSHGRITARGGRVLVSGTPQPGLYAAGWAVRAPQDKGSHAADAAVVARAIWTDLLDCPRPRRQLADVFAQHGVAPTRIDGWSAVSATEVLLDRFDGECTLPLADYDQLLGEVDED